MTDSDTQVPATTEQSNGDGETGSPTSASQGSAQEPALIKEDTVKLETYQALQVQAQQYLEGWQRERSDFANYQRRTDRELKASRDNITGDTYKTILPVIDDFERAMASVPPEIQGTLWVNGVGMILRKFHKILEENNVTIIDPTGEVFDPSQHEAIGTEDVPDVESGLITATMQKGYLVGDRVLRPALVRVAL